MFLHIFPILLFAITIGSFYTYQRTNHDIYGVLALASAVVCLMWGLVVAHWLVHLLILVILLKITSNLISKTSPAKINVD